MLPIGRTFVDAQVTVDSSSAGAAAAPPRLGMLTHPGGDGRQRQQQAAPPGTAAADPFVTLSDWKLQVPGGGGRLDLDNFAVISTACPLTQGCKLTCLRTYLPAGVRAEQQPEPHRHRC